MIRQGSRFALTASPRAVQALFGYRDEVDFPPRYNIAPTQPIAVVHRLHGERRFTLMRWGFVPGWVKDPRDDIAARHGACRDRRRAAGVQRGVPLSPLPRPGVRLLRLAARARPGQASLLHSSAGRRRDRARRTLGDLVRRRRQRGRHRLPPHRRRRSQARGDFRPHAGRRRAGRVRAMARAGRIGRRPALAPPRPSSSLPSR